MSCHFYTPFVLVALAVAGCALAEANEHPHAEAPTIQRHTTALGLAGYSPVSYRDDVRAEPGSPAIAAEHEGVTYFFTSDRQRQRFLADPERYLPAYGGYCAFGCSVDAKLVPDPTSFEIIEGRTHLFLRNEEINARKLWHEGDLDEVRAKADRFWAAQQRASNEKTAE